MTVLNTNISALVAQNAVNRNQKVMAQAMERLSTGKRINNGADDPAGLAISARMEMASRSALQGIRNANDAMSMLQTITSAGQHITDILIRMKELAVQSGSDTLQPRDRVTLDNEFNQLGLEITRIYTNTLWNGDDIMASGSVADAAALTPVNIRLDGGTGNLAMVFKSWNFTNVTANQNVWGQTAAAADNNANAFRFTPRTAGTNSLGVANTRSFTHIDTTAAATSAITLLDRAITGATAELAQYGAYTNRLEFAVENLTSVATTADESRSRIEDADYASETSNLSRTQIMAQAATAMLAQANASQQTVLALLQ